MGEELIVKRMLRRTEYDTYLIRDGHSVLLDLSDGRSVKLHTGDKVVLEDWNELRIFLAPQPSQARR